MTGKRVAPEIFEAIRFKCASILKKQEGNLLLTRYVDKYCNRVRYWYEVTRKGRVLYLQAFRGLVQFSNSPQLHSYLRKNYYRGKMNLFFSLKKFFLQNEVGSVVKPEYFYHFRLPY